MELKKELIIIPDEKQIKNLVYSRKLEKDESYSPGIKEFSDKYDLKLKESNYNNNSGFIEIAKLGHLVIQKDETITLYIPPILTKNQYRFFVENKRNIMEHGTNIHVISLSGENKNLTNSITVYENNEIDTLYQELREKYIPNNDSYVLIIPDEKELQIKNGLYQEEFDSNLLDGHGRIYQIFCMLNQIMLDIPHDGGYFFGKELADRNIMSVIKEDNEIYIFIPRKLSNNQYQWFQGKEDYLMSFELLEAGVYKDDGEYKEVFQNNPTDIQKTNLDLVNEIYEYVNARKPNNEISK